LKERIERSRAMRFYPFRTRCGDVLLILEGWMDGSRIKYLGNPDIGAENGVILFEDGSDE
jgi:hypothetical protein